MLADRSNRLRTTIAHPNAVKVAAYRPVQIDGMTMGELKVKI